MKFRGAMVHLRMWELLSAFALWWAAPWHAVLAVDTPLSEKQSQFQLPDGFSIHLVASEPLIVNPMSIAVDAEGQLWVTEAHTYRWGTNGSPVQPPTNPIKRFSRPSDGSPATMMIAADGFPEPVIGVAVFGNKLYATCLNELFSMDIGPGGKLLDRKLLVKDAAKPWNPFGMYRVLVRPDGKLWFSIADHPSTGPVQLTGSDGRQARFAGQSGGLARCNLDGSGLELVAHGFRAPYAFDIDPWGHVWLISNGENSPNIYAHLIPGLDYGYASRAVSYAWLAGHEALAPPVRDLGPGANTAALHYYGRQFPAEYHGSIFIANWGSHGPGPANRDLRCFRRLKDGQDQTGSSDSSLSEAGRFLTSSDPKFRPTGLAMAPDGSLYLIDWHGRDDENDLSGRIYLIRYDGTPRDSRPPREHPATNRMEINSLADVAEQGQPLDAAEAIWRLTRIATAPASQALASGLRHKDPRIRAHALRQLRQAAGQTLAGDQGSVPLGGILFSKEELALLARPFLDDSDAEARVEAALAQTSTPARTLGLLSALSARPNERLLYQIGLHLGRYAEANDIMALFRSQDSGLRKAGQIAIESARHEKTSLAARVSEIELSGLAGASRAQKLEDVDKLETAPPAALIAALENLDPTKRQAALRAIRLQGAMEQELLNATLSLVQRIQREREEKSTVKALEACASKEVLLEAIFTLGCFGNMVELGLWLSFFEDRDEQVVTAALRALREIPPRPELVERLAGIAEALAKRSADLRDDVRLTLQWLGVRDLEQCFKSKPGQDAVSSACSSEIVEVAEPSISELSHSVVGRLSKASPALGRLTFQSVRAGCVKCHSARVGEFTRYGPNLAEIGAASSAAYLIESLLEPSKVIKTGFQMERIECADGRVWTGLVEAAEGRLLVTSGPADEEWVALREVKSRSPAEVSLMPEGLAAAMTEAELADLVAYLSSLKGASLRTVSP